MSKSRELPIAHLRGPILRSVSRSFFLSIRLLPAPLRDPIALAYLLARATDTIADTAEIDPDLRTPELAKLADLIQGGPADLNSFGVIATLQKNHDERALIEALPACLRWLNGMAEADRAEIRNALIKINHGQRLDLERFRNPAEIVALRTAAELDEYTYLVAGSVGEFWTNLCFLHLPKFATLPRAEMHSLGKEYGQGLQLVNILRDLGTDLRGGRCYLPAEELHSLGMLPADLKTTPERAENIVQSWLGRAEVGLTAGLDYACAINSWRVRLATALPALIGARTVSLLKREGTNAFARKIKVSRAEVRQIILHALATAASRRSLQTAFKTLLSS